MRIHVYVRSITYVSSFQSHLHIQSIGTVYTLEYFFPVVFIRILVLVYMYTMTCHHVCNNNLCVKFTFLHYVNLTYESMSMRAGLTYKGIACVLYQHT